VIYHVLFPDGAYKQKFTEDWLNGLTLTHEAQHPAVIQVAHDNEAQTDYWKEVELNDERYAAIDFKSGFWAGWYDLFQAQTLALYEGYNTKSAESVRGQSKLLVDPCGHCIEAQDFWTENIVEGRSAVVLSQAFDVFGVDRFQRRDDLIKNITFYVMSSNDEAGKEAGQYWTTLEKWPEAKMTDYYLLPSGVASTDVADYGIQATTQSIYDHDPLNPVPTIGGNNLPASMGGSIPCGPMDQGTTIDFRDDVLRFETAISEDELVLTGQISATLYVSSDQLDTDFNVKISDVYPTGEVIILVSFLFSFLFFSVYLIAPCI
jgi:putative CocE/NonD family hydrolase